VRELVRNDEDDQKDEGVVINPGAWGLTPGACLASTAWEGDNGRDTEMRRKEILIMAEVKKIVITGVSRGLGRAILDLFVEGGHHVAGCCRAEEGATELKQAYGAPHDFSAVNVADEQQVERWAGRVLAEFGPPDLLLNNAALINANAVLWEVPPAEFSRLVDVNVKGVYYVIRHFVPAMVERNAGVIVNFSSGWGRATSPQVAPYCTTKWAVEGMSQALASELPSGLASIALNPGIIHTDMLESVFGAMANSFPNAEAWAKKAAPFLLQLGPRNNGESLTVPM
jgi:NAD(P)-dependent dehydrogenase (short-subunit alcohol dehydrogenase family)